MNISISDKLLQGVNLSEQEARLEFAVGLFTDRRVTLGRAAEIAEVSQTDFLKELGRRRIPIHYNVEDYEHDLNVVRETKGK